MYWCLPLAWTIAAVCRAHQGPRFLVHKRRFLNMKAYLKNHYNSKASSFPALSVCPRHIIANGSLKSHLGQHRRLVIPCTQDVQKVKVRSWLPRSRGRGNLRYVTRGTSTCERTSPTVLQAVIDSCGRGHALLSWRPTDGWAAAET